MALKYCGWLKVLLNATQKLKCLKEVGHLPNSVSHTQSTQVSHLKSVLLKDLAQFSTIFSKTLKCQMLVIMSIIFTANTEN